jgi:hypothetical protein
MKGLIMLLFEERAGFATLPFSFSPLKQLSDRLHTFG